MKNAMFLAVALLMLAAGCAKKTTPKRVEKLLVGDEWKISTFSMDGESVYSSYSAYEFKFESNGIITAVGEDFVANGHWETGLDKRPAIIYFTFTSGHGLEFLADDWMVKEMYKNKMKLERNDPNGDGGILIFSR